MGERTGCGHAGGVGDASQGGEHAAGEKPPSHETEHQQERQHRGCPRSEDVQEVGPDGKDARGWCCGAAGDDERPVGDVAQQEQPHGGEQQGAGEHEEARVAEGEFEANAQTRGSIHGLLPRARCLVGVDAVPGAGHGGDDPGLAEAFAQCRDVMRTAFVNGSAF